MPRPGKSERESLRLSGVWVEKPPYPKGKKSTKRQDAGMLAFCSGEDDTIPNPGGYAPQLNFTSNFPECNFFANGPLFEEFSDVMCQAVDDALPTPVFQASEELGSPGDSMLAAAHVAAACQISKAHRKMGLGDLKLEELEDEFVNLPSFLHPYLYGMGETKVPEGNSWLYADCESEVRAIIRSAYLLSQGERRDRVASVHWLPTSPEDERSRFILAYLLHHHLKDRGSPIPFRELEEAIFSGIVPTRFSFLANQPRTSDLITLECLFKPITSAEVFLSNFGGAIPSAALATLGLKWDKPSLRDLSFDLNYHTAGMSVISRWNDIVPALEEQTSVKYRNLSLTRLGDESQFCQVTRVGSNVRVCSHRPLSSDVRAFRACFGTPVKYQLLPLRWESIGTGVNPTDVARVIGHDVMKLP